MPVDLQSIRFDAFIGAVERFTAATI